MKIYFCNLFRQNNIIFVLLSSAKNKKNNFFSHYIDSFCLPVSCPFKNKLSLVYCDLNFFSRLTIIL